MNKYQEALGILNNVPLDDKNNEIIRAEATHNLQELIDRATPMKPKEIYTTAMGLRLGVCPLCGITVFEGMGCPKCIQALDWE